VSRSGTGIVTASTDIVSFNCFDPDGHRIEVYRGCSGSGESALTG
jgi:hypothetical protein